MARYSEHNVQYLGLDHGSVTMQCQTVDIDPGLGSIAKRRGRWTSLLTSINHYAGLSVMACIKPTIKLRTATSLQVDSTASRPLFKAVNACVCAQFCESQSRPQTATYILGLRDHAISHPTFDSDMATYIPCSVSIPRCGISS